MLTVPQTAALLRTFDNILILTHVRPDGDTVGCAAALCAGLRSLGKAAFLLPNPELTDTTAPYFRPYEAPEGFTPDKVVSTDIATVGLFPENARPYAERVDLAIDHHPSFESFGRENIVRPEAAACGELIYDILSDLGPITPEMALPLYVAVSTDTGCFAYANTTAQTHAVAAALLILLLFAAVAGFTPSVSRSCIMCGLMLAALLVNKEYDGPAALAFAAVVMLIGNPLVITSVGFQLSVASVAGIYLFAPGIRKWLVSLFPDSKGKGVRPMLIRWFTASVSITLSAMIFTTPLSAWYFGTVSLVGVVTNLLTLWVISFIFYGLVAVSLVGAFWTGGAMILGKIVAWPIRYVLLIAKLLAGFPLAAVYTRSPYITIWLVAVYVLLPVFLLSRNRRPGVLLCCGTLGLCLALLASWAEPMLDSTRVTVLDVGQGQCILLQSEGRTYMVDCGGDSDTETADIAAETLLSQGISRLDGLILTHGDRDHTGAAENLLSRVKADILILPPEEGMPTSDNAEVVYAEQDLLLTYGKTNLHIFTTDSNRSENENSLCVLFDTENCDILITGDRSAYGERMLLHAGKIPEVDVLIAGHHGSKNSTCEDLLAAAQPQTVCISAGRDNLYGHPAAETLQRLENFGCTVYRTDRDGTITIRR